MTFQTVVKTVARSNGLYADFSAKPLDSKPGNGFHGNISVEPSDHTERMNQMIAGILDKVPEMTLFLNPTENSYKRFGLSKAPGYVSWSHENRSQLIRIPAAIGEYRRAELRSPDPTANPYLVFSLLIYAGLYGIENQLPLPAPTDINLYRADQKTLAAFKRLPDTLKAAAEAARDSEFIRKHIPQTISDKYSHL